MLGRGVSACVAAGVLASFSMGRVERRYSLCRDFFPIDCLGGASMTGWMRLKFALIATLAAFGCIGTAGCANEGLDRISPASVGLRMVAPRFAKDANPDYCEKCCIEVIRQYQQAVDRRDYARAVLISEPMDRVCSERVSGGGSS